MVSSERRSTSPNRTLDHGFVMRVPPYGSGTQRARRPSPEGTHENSPPFQRWVAAGRGAESRRGTTEQGALNTIRSRPHGVFNRPFGTPQPPTSQPNLERLGYC